VRAAAKLPLVVAQCPGEVALAAWSEFDIERGAWTIQSEANMAASGEGKVAVADLNTFETSAQIAPPAEPAGTPWIR